MTKCSLLTLFTYGRQKSGNVRTDCYDAAHTSRHQITKCRRAFKVISQSAFKYLNLTPLCHNAIGQRNFSIILIGCYILLHHVIGHFVCYLRGSKIRKQTNNESRLNQERCYHNLCKNRRRSRFFPGLRSF